MGICLEGRQANASGCNISGAANERPASEASDAAPRTNRGPGARPNFCLLGLEQTQPSPSCEQGWEERRAAQALTVVG